MLDKYFNSILKIEGTYAIDVKDFLTCIAISLLCGLIIALGYTVKNKYTSSFVITLSLLPAMVCVVILTVNGNVGMGVAVAGTFSLVRFRSVPGSAKEIAIIFLAMATGLISGTGYLGYALLFSVMMTAVYVLYSLIGSRPCKKDKLYKTLSITIPEDLNYSDAFKDILSQYTKSYELIKVKTTNMGSLYKLTYNIVLKKSDCEKELIDKLRCRNGNLEISIYRQENMTSEL